MFQNIYVSYLRIDIDASLTLSTADRIIDAFPERED